MFITFLFGAEGSLSSESEELPDPELPELLSSPSLDEDSDDIDTFFVLVKYE